MAYGLYAFLVTVRFAWVFQPQTGYIHPDEFFQNTEPLAGDVFGYDVHRTWEFNKTQLARSLFFPTLTSGIPFTLLRALSDLELVTVTPYLLLVLPRLAMALASLATDYCVYQMSKILRSNPEKCLNVFASSYVVLVFCTRTFSNPIEMGVYALILLMVVDSRQYQLVRQKEIAVGNSGGDTEQRKPGEGEGKSESKGKGQPKSSDQSHQTEVRDGDENGEDSNEGEKISRQELSRRNMKNISAGFWLGIFLLEGFFNRVTLGLYALFPLLFWLTGSATSCSLSSIKTIVKNAFLILPGFLTHLLIHFVLDSLYAETLDARMFTDFDFLVANLNFDLLRNVTITPLNLIRYNLDSGNLGLHGIHPRITHFFVNLPMLCLPLVVCFVSELFSFYTNKEGSRQRATFHNSTSRAFLGLCFFTPVLLISLFPHQEARYVIPAMIPLILLYADMVTFPGGFPNVPWIMWNLLGAVVFGVIHQGGMLPCLEHIRGVVSEPPPPGAEPISYHMVFFHTYMPPRHLLMRAVGANNDEDANKLHIHDMMGSDRLTMLSVVDKLMALPSKSFPTKMLEREVYVVAPASLDQIFCKKNIKNNFRLVESFGPHLSMEDPPTLFPSYRCVEQLERSPASMDISRKLQFSFSLNLYKVVRVIHVQMSS